MKSRKDSEDLTRVGPDTVMGNFMRQYWIPAAQSSELEADGTPMRLMLLGEKLIAFRDTHGRVGVMDHMCPHRNASLFLGRNEEGGIRCIYHGWKFDVEGRCVDMPSIPPAQCFKDKVKAGAYRVAERNGIIWVYMGPRQEAPPPLPQVEATLLPEGEVDISFMMRSCNWMQALEGDIDTSHFGFLHVGHLDPEDVPPGHPLEHTASERAPQYHVRDTPWGTNYGAYRTVRPQTTYWRFANYMYPFWTQTPQGDFPVNIQARAWVPLDDHHTMMIFWRRRVPNLRNTNEPLRHGQPLGGSRPQPDFHPRGTGWLDRWRVVADETNDWLIDREAQRTNRIYSGIDHIGLQDQAVTESMGPITDHGREHLGPGDLMIARTRRRALQAARAFAETGQAPGVEQPEVMMGARSGYFEAPDTVEWQAAYDEQMRHAERATVPAPASAPAPALAMAK
ncbi:Rieske 2Fe-2S domain-containing protein [Ramlibacter sp. AN1015]|uniref:Rieske 2Fe-2S domain-containing protein n=1 Tax=Ramlibacter sp. AN1015 TaxID=3133428 RepID=UPI0030C4B5E8